MNPKVQGRPSSSLEPKTLNNVDGKTAKANVFDMEVFGDVNAFKLLSKASSSSQGWMKSTKGMEISGVGVIVQTTTQQRNVDGTNALAEATVFVPGVRLIEDKNPQGKVVGRRLQHT